MANTPDDASKQPPSVPDLKKAAEAKAAQPYVWAPTAKSAASAPSVLGAPRHEPTAFERLNTTGGRLAVMAGLMLVVGGGISLTAFHDTGGAGGSSDLSKPNSTIKSRAFLEKDGVSLTRGRDDSTVDRMKINAKAAAKDGYAMGGARDGTAGAEGGEGGEPMNYDEGGGKGNSSGASSGGAQGAGAGGNAKGGGTDAFSAGGVAAPKLSSTGKIKFQGMRRISGTAGFRGIGGRTGTPSKIQTRGSAANNSSSLSDSARGGKAGSGFTSLADTGGSVGALGGSGGAGAADGSAAGGGGGGGSGGGAGGGGVNTDGLDEIQDNIPSIPELLAQAASLRKDADKEEKKAKILAVQGQMPQAHYHYNKAEKKKKEAQGYEDQANQQTQMMTDTAAGMTTTPPP